MKALLLAAGLGTRLYPIVQNLPKCLVPVGGIPLIDYWLYQLVSADIKEILINTHYLSELVLSHISKSKWKKYITISYEETLLGTAGTLLKNKKFFEDGSFLVAHADNLTIFDANSFMDCHKNRPDGIDITMMTFTTDIPQNCGIVEIDKNNIVLKFHEKVKNPPSNHANGAVYIMEPSVFNTLKNFSLSQTIDISCNLIPLYMEKIQAWHNNIYLRDIGTPDSLQKANEDIVSYDCLKELRQLCANINFS